MGRPGRPKGSGRRDRSLKTVDRKPIRPLERQRMRPWLLRLLEDGGSDQICWQNKREKTFRMAWKHAAGQNWDRGQDCNLFELWARHTGKYYDGDKPDHKRWKANFRCALNSLLDVEEIKGAGIKRGNNAFKVYKFLDEKRVKKATEIKEEPLDEAIFLSRSYGTKSRPRRPTMDLDSEGSEMETNDLEYSDDFEISKDSYKEETEHSPLPHFDQICPLNSELQRSLGPATRFPEACSPQTGSSTSDDDVQSTTSSAPTDEEVISMLMEPEDKEVPDFWLAYPYVVDLTVLESPEEVIAEDGETLLTNLSRSASFEGPSVIVEESVASSDFTYTSLTL